MDSLTLAIVGAAYGTSIAVGLSRRARAKHSSPEGLLALMVACCVAAIGTIVLQHRFGIFVSLLERIEYVATLSCGPLLFLYLRSISGASSSRRELIHFLPAVAALVLPTLDGDPLLGMPIQLVMVHQISYTAASAFVRVRAERVKKTHARLSTAILIVMSVAHAAQIVRSFWSDIESLQDVVPVTLSIIVLLIGAGAILRIVPGSAGKVSRRPPERVVPAESLDEHPVLVRIERLMNEEHLYRDPDLSLRALADRIGETPHQLSAALNEGAGISLTDYLAQRRLEDAKSRLGDPDHEIYTIEGIAGMSGFGSRSSFYAVFKRETGMTPAEYRKKSGVAAQSGRDATAR